MANEARQPKFKVEDIVRLIDIDVLLKITGVEPCLGTFRYDAVDLMGTKYTCIEANLQRPEYEPLKTDMTKFTEEDITPKGEVENPIVIDEPTKLKTFQATVEAFPFEGVLSEMRSLYIAKNADYGDSFAKSVEKYGLISALTRISDKFNRAEQLIMGNEAKVKDEKLRDTLIDLASYAIMTIVELDKTK